MSDLSVSEIGEVICLMVPATRTHILDHLTSIGVPHEVADAVFSKLVIEERLAVVPDAKEGKVWDLASTVKKRRCEDD